MLEKQGCKFISFQDAIVSKVFKAKYFLNVDFLDAKLGHNPSFVWHSIFASQSVIKEGVKCRIGNGNSIAIWKQPWLRRNDYPYVSTAPPGD